MFTRSASYGLRSSLLLLCLGMTGSLFAAGAAEQQATLYQRLGGLAPISVVVNDFVDVLGRDSTFKANPAIDAARQRVAGPYLKFQITAMVCQATGGPCQYHGRSMKESHVHLNITTQEWDHMVLLFKEVLAKHKVPATEQQELLAIVGSTKADIVTGSK